MEEKNTHYEEQDNDDEEMIEEVPPCGSECGLEAEDTLLFQIQNPKTGVKVTNRKFHLKTYEKVFTGEEAVTFICAYEKVDRVQAVSIGQALLSDGVFSHVKKDHAFLDEKLFYRFAKHDKSTRIKPEDIDVSIAFQLSVRGFKGCPFCARAIEAVESLAEEVGPSKLIADCVEYDGRNKYKDFLLAHRPILQESAPVAAYHTSSPICYITDSNQYIGGLDDMLLFLGKLKPFKDTKAIKKYKPESPFSTFAKGIPTIGKNLKSVLKINKGF